MKRNLFFILSLILAHSALSQNWEALGQGFSLPIRAMYSDTLDNYLYVGGNVKDITADGRVLKGVARWDGLKWDSLGNGVSEGTNVFAFARYHNDLYVGGTFDSVGNMKCKGIGVWKGSYWDSMGVLPFKPYTFNYYISDMAVINDELYFGGAFDSVNNLPSRCFAKWDGSILTPIGIPSNITFAYIFSICEYHGYIYVGGNFSTNLYPNDTIQDIMRYDGSNWSSVGGGMKGGSTMIYDMVVYDDELYVGGYFFKGDGNTGNHIQKWDGFSWSEVGGGLGGSSPSVSDLTIFQNKLYAVGTLESAGGIPAQFIASWDGTDWCGYGSYFDNIPNVSSVYNDSLFIGSILDNRWR
jgi:hypothetical protein